MYRCPSIYIYIYMCEEARWDIQKAGSIYGDLREDIHAQIQTETEDSKNFFARGVL